MKPKFPMRCAARFRPILPALAMGLAVLAAGCGENNKPVVVPPLSSVVVVPSDDTLQVGQVHLFSATAKDLGGAVVTVPFSWFTSDPNIATVNGSGQTFGVGEGSARIVAEAGGLSDTVIVSVYPDTGWIAQTSNASENLYGVAFRPDGRTGWAVGASGLILSTLDAGVTWTREAPTNFNLNAVWFWTDDNGCVVGNGGTVLMSRRQFDGSLIWVRPDSIFAGENLYDVTFANSDSLIGWAVGQNGVILRTINGGKSWQKQFVGGQNLRAVSFSGSRDGWAAGDNGILLGTHDRGVNWFILQPSVTGNNLKGLWRASTLRAIAVGAAGVTPQTWVPPADTIQWRLENAGAQFQLNGVCFGDSVAFAVGSNSGTGAILRSDDFGVTWTPQTPRSQFALNDVFFIDHVHGWAVGNSGAIRHTARGGGK